MRKFKDPRGDKKPGKAGPPKNYRPALETIISTGDASAMPEKLVVLLERIMALAKERGIEKEVKELLAGYASTEHDVHLAMKILDSRADKTPSMRTRGST